MAYIDSNAAELLGSMHDEPAGTIVRVMPRRMIDSNGVAVYTTTGQVAVTAIAIPAGVLVTNIAILSGGTAANGPTHWWFGLTDSQLNVLAVSADQTSGAIAANTWLKLAMTVPYLVPQTGVYYVVSSVSASVTAPTAHGVAVTAQLFGSATNMPGPIVCGTAGNQATPPAIGTQINSGTVTATANLYAAWIS